MKTASWRVSALSVICAMALQACGGGGGSSDPAPVAKPADSTSNNNSGGNTGGGGSNANGPVAAAVDSNKPVTVNTSAALVLNVNNSTAQLTLPANAFVVQNSPGTAVTGNIVATVMPIDPSGDPMNMQGGQYRARGADGSAQRLESFGAIRVYLNQGTTPVQLASGNIATIRIPLQTRSSERPATIPLYYWDETAAIWVEEGTATLKGNATNGFFYEGQVSRMAVWNADKPIEQSVQIQGCVESTKGVALPADVFSAVTKGLDYSGMDWSVNSDGKFTVMAKKGGKVSLTVSPAPGKGDKQVRELGVVSDNMVDPKCFVLNSETPQPPVDNAKAEGFFKLQGDLTSALLLGARGAEAVDGDKGLMLSPSNVCHQGSVSGLSFDGKPVQGGEPISSGALHIAAITFKGCVPSTDKDASELTGQSNFSFRYGVNEGFLQFVADSVVIGMQDATQKLAANGGFHIESQRNGPAKQIFVIPATNATLTNLASANTAVLKSGSMSASSVDGPKGEEGELISYVQTFNKLTYVLNGATYVLNGQTDTGAGQVTLSKNGNVIATLQLTRGKAPEMTGTVDPF